MDLTLFRISVSYTGVLLRVTSVVDGSGKAWGLSPRRRVHNVVLDELGSGENDAHMVAEAVRAVVGDIEFDLRRDWRGEIPLF